MYITTVNLAEEVYRFELSRNSSVEMTSSPPWLNWLDSVLTDNVFVYELTSIEEATKLAREMSRLKLDLTSGEVLETTLALKLNSTLLSVLKAKTNVSPSGKCAEKLCDLVVLRLLTVPVVVPAVVLVILVMLALTALTVAVVVLAVLALRVVDVARPDMGDVAAATVPLPCCRWVVFVVRFSRCT